MRREEGGKDGGMEGGRERERERERASVLELVGQVKVH